ncbi:MAG: hypothetical protein KGK17_04805 [Betaproteobacteria bacterium]|nr:hypothetical protein [Betaproteobacteria bacterium]
MNKKFGWLMIFVSGFFVAINLAELLPHDGGLNAGWGKLITALIIGAVGVFWCRKE